MASQELTDFQINLAETEENVRCVREKASTAQDIVGVATAGLDALDDTTKAVQRIDTQITKLQAVTEAATKIPPISGAAKSLDRVLDSIAKFTGELNTNLTTLNDRAEPVRDALEKIDEGLEIFVITLEGTEESLSALHGTAEIAEIGLQSLEDSGATVDEIEDCLDQVLAPANNFLEDVNDRTDEAKSFLDTTIDLFRPDFDFDLLIDIGTDLTAISDILDLLSVPLDALDAALEPVEWALEKSAEIYDSVVAPVVDPVLEALGIPDAIEKAVDELLGLVPDVDLFDLPGGPLDLWFDEFDGFFADFINRDVFDLPQIDFNAEFDDFLKLNGIIDIFRPTLPEQGLPFDFTVHGIDPAKPEFWIQIQTEDDRTANVGGGFLFGEAGAQTLRGNDGSDAIFGGAGRDSLISNQSADALGAADIFLGGAGDDVMDASGNVTLIYGKRVDNYLITQDEEPDGTRFITIRDIADQSRDGEGTDTIYFDSATKIQFEASGTPNPLNPTAGVLNLEEFLRGYQAADADNPNLTGDREGPIRDFLIGGTSEFTDPPAPDQVNILDGLALEDFLSGGPGDDILYGGTEDDFLSGGAGADILYGGEGLDLAAFDDLDEAVDTNAGFFGEDGKRGAQLYLDRTQSQAEALGFFLTDQVFEVERVLGSQFQDIIFGQRNTDNILLGEGDVDVLRGVGAGSEGNQVDGGAGDDAIVLDSGRDMAFGGNGTDIFYTALDSQFLTDGNTVDGGNGTDLLFYSHQRPEDQSVTREATTENTDLLARINEVIFSPEDFGEGLDLSETMAGGSITVDAAAGTVTRQIDGEASQPVDLFSDIEIILGSPGNDTFIANETTDGIQFVGGAGDDLFLGLGADLDSEGNRDFDFVGNPLIGSTGNDTFQLSGTHEVRGGADVDTLDLSQSDGFWIVDVTEFGWSNRSGALDNLPLYQHFEDDTAIRELGEFEKIFLDSSTIENPDPLPFWAEPDQNDPNDPFIVRFNGPLIDGTTAAGIEKIIGSENGDVILGGATVMEIRGEGGDDQLAVRVFEDQDDFGSTDFPPQVIYGGAGDDHLIGNFGAELLYGGDGDDILDTAANRIDGTTGMAYGGSGADLFHALDFEGGGQFPGAQQIFGGEDTFTVTLGDGSEEVREFQDAIDFGDGEVALRNNRDEGVIFALDNSQTGNLTRGLTVQGIENVFGTRQRDQIYGDDEDNILIGRAGDDDLYGAGGNDILIGGPGNDRMEGGTGNDIFLTGESFANPNDNDGFFNPPDVDGGEGVDTISFQFLRPDGRGSTIMDIEAFGIAEIRLDTGEAFFAQDRAEPGDLPEFEDNSTLEDPNPPRNRSDLTSIENATGGRLNDVIYGSDSDNVLVGNNGDDSIFGGAGNDVIGVGLGNDLAAAGAGDDLVFGARGDNSLDGGDDTDTLDFTANQLGLSFDLDAGTIDADFNYTTYVYDEFAADMDARSLAEREAETKPGGSSDGGALGPGDLTATDIFKIENPTFADRFYQLEEGFVRSAFDGTGALLGRLTYVQESETRTYTSTVTGFETFESGDGDDSFTYSDGSGFAGLIDGGGGFDMLDLSGVTGLVTFETIDNTTTVLIDGNAPGLAFRSIEAVMTSEGTTSFNTAPIAADDTEITGKATSLVAFDLLGNDGDGNIDITGNGDTLTLMAVSVEGTLGQVIDNGDGTVDYDPAGAFDALGRDERATDVFRYTVMDSSGATDTAVVLITIDGDDALPVAEDDGPFETDEDTVLRIGPDALLANDTAGLTLTAVSGAQGGTVEIEVDGRVAFTPDPNTSGPASFIYQVTDQSDQTAEATVTVTVLPVEDLPVAADDITTTSEDTPVTVAVLDNDSDGDGDLLSITTFGQGATGSVILDTNGNADPSDDRLIYTPEVGFVGTDTFTYTLSDGDDSTTATVTVMVEARTQIDGTSASERVIGTGAGEVLDGGAGTDRYTGGDGADIFVLARGDKDRVDDFQLGLDRIDVSDWGTQAFDELSFKGGAGRILITDTFSGERAQVRDAGGTLTASDLTAESFVFAPVSEVTVTGTDGPDRLSGRAGDDTIDGLAGSDRYLGNEGADLFILGAGDRDRVDDFDPTEDVVDVSTWGTTSLDELTVNSSNGRITISDTFSNNLAQLRNPTIDLDATALTDDAFMFAATEDISLTGTDGSDRLIGRSGNDAFDGGLGQDRYVGNGGADTFVLGIERDRVEDYQDGLDLLDISAWGVTSFDSLRFDDKGAGRVLIVDTNNVVADIRSGDAAFNASQLDAFDFVGII